MGSLIPWCKLFDFLVNIEGKIMEAVFFNGAKIGEGSYPQAYFVADKLC